MKNIVGLYFFTNKLSSLVLHKSNLRNLYLFEFDSFNISLIPDKSLA